MCLQVRLINVGSRVPNPNQLVKLNVERQQRDVAALKLRSRPLVESNERYVTEIMPAWHGSPSPKHSAATSPAASPVPASMPQHPQRPHDADAAEDASEQGQLVAQLKAHANSMDLNHLRHALRSAERQKVARDVKLRQQGTHITRHLPVRVRLQQLAAASMSIFAAIGKWLPACACLAPCQLLRQALSVKGCSPQYMLRCCPDCTGDRQASQASAGQA